MTTLSPAQSRLMQRSKAFTITHSDGSTSTHGRLVSGHEYRTALALEKMGLGTLRHQGPGRGWFTRHESPEISTTD